MDTAESIAMGGHVLIVDDEAENLRFLGQLLVSQGYQVHVADSGERALETLESLGQEPDLDLIMLDILMPNGIDGIETCRRLKAHPGMSTTPVVFLTGKDDRNIIVDAFAAGGADYVVKPFDAEVLLARARAHAELGRLSRGMEAALAERTRELRDANVGLQAANEQLRRLATELSLVEQREKKRLAAELHDSPMQKLTLAQIQIASAARWRDAESDRLLGVGLELLRDALEELRTLQFELSPPLLHQEGLGPALRWLVSHLAKRCSVELAYVEAQPMPPLDQDLAILMFQCARELLYNLIKHAEASRGLIELGCSGGTVTLTVSDDGKGLTKPAKTDSRPRWGLMGIRERLSLWNGKLDIQSDRLGTEATVTVRPPDSVACASATQAPALAIHSMGKLQR
jgi:signal transduction histidine kinase